jgi:tRNA pseudouridine55 synthase
MIFDNKNIDKIDLFIESVITDGAAILIDKPLEWTSFNVVAKIRNTLRIKKIGHAGTLDPLATGLLILCLGKYTKKINDFQDLYKEYTGIVKIGATTKSFDSEFEEDNICDISSITSQDVESTANTFLGKQQQIPPMFSAKKVKGKRLYELARKDIEIEVQSSSVEFFDINVDYNAPNIEFYIKCSKGTYIRSFARDIGQKLNVGGYLSKLRRTGIGEFKVEDAIQLPVLIELLNRHKMESAK